MFKNIIKSLVRLLWHPRYVQCLLFRSHHTSPSASSGNISQFNFYFVALTWQMVVFYLILWFLLYFLIITHS